MNIEEQDLVEGCKSGKQDAYRHLYYTYASSLLHIIGRYISDRSTAHDLLHDTFLKVFDKIETFEYRGAGSLAAWLNRIAGNEALMHLRKESRWADFPAEEMNLKDETDNEEPEAELVQNLSYEQILSCIHRLPTGYRTVFILYVIEGYSHKQIAETLGIAERSSASQLSRARKLLAKEINLYNATN